MDLIHRIDRSDALAVAVSVRGVEVRPSGPALLGRLEALYLELRAGRVALDERRRKAVRALLRNGRYSPSGRGKPASEYLLSVWEKQGHIDLINNAVDVNNLVSLASGLPISAFDEDELRGDLVLRLGEEGEGYVFNASGQELACRDLVVICDDRGPIGSPVKDSQATKLFPGSTRALYVLYGNAEEVSAEELSGHALRLGEAFVEDCPGALIDGPRPFVRRPAP